MSEVKIDTKYKRKPFLALVLSLAMPGLGHIYCGRIVKGLIFTFLATLPFAAIAGMLIDDQSKKLLALSAGWLVLSLICLVAVIDSWYTARHTRADYTLKDYNRWYFYLLLLLICEAGGTIYALHFRDNYIEAFRVPTASNYPTILPGDRLLANKLAYRTKDPQRGDLVVFTNPRDRRMNFIKRVVAVAGDTVEIKQGQLFINDKELQCRKLDASVLDKIRIEIQGKVLAGQVYEEINGDAKYRIFIKAGNDPNEDNFACITVPQYHCFVLGDNRYMSEDSRNLGSIPIAAIKGRADYLYYFAKDWSRFGSLRAN